MEKLSLKKYRKMALKYFGGAIFLIAFCGITGMAEGLEAETSFGLIVVLSGIFLVIPGIVRLVQYFYYRKKIRNVEPQVGVIDNWQAGLGRHTGKVVMKIDGKEIATPAYFSHREAKDLVGKTVEYAVFEDVLFLFGEAGETRDYF